MAELNRLETDILSQVSAASNEAELEAARVAALGKKGSISELLKGLGGMSPEERRTMGPALNGLKGRVGEAIQARRGELQEAELERRLATENIDVTLPVRESALEAGRIHPVSQVMDEITAIFADMGFSIAEGPHIENDFNNFTALNIPADHPARQEMDTFYFPEKDDGSRMLLRTHTSPVQIRTLLENEPPVRIIAPGRVYRCDYDQTHTPMFHQVEGLVIDEEAHLGHLKWVLEEFCKAFFEVDDVKMRFRASHFPFTEPSMEVDINCTRSGSEVRIGEGDDWLEILGCGVVHPNVLRACDLDPKRYQGFAWGMGIDRIAMLKYGTPDLRAFFSADLRWLRHYGFLPLDVPTLAGGFKSMKFTLKWLNEHLETGASLEEIVDKLSLIGLEVEDVHNPADLLAPFKVAHVVSAEQHPNADKLRVCKVDTGTGIMQVVCGAPNARTGMKGVFAPSGTHIPGTGLDLKPTKIRGVESNGMLVSEREMGLSDDHEGIIDLPEITPIGKPLAEVLDLNDPVIEIAVTPNRPDALGIAGIARDLAAAELGTVITPEPERIEGSGPCPVPVTIEFSAEDAHLCPAFAMRLVRGVKNGPSPAWLQQRLEAIGLRPINALVDITNYITYDRNRPLHVFDAAKVKGGLTVRHAKAGEELLALDGKTYAFEPSHVVIADENGVESIGGIMGGEPSGCDETTTDVLIESALWDTSATARTGRALNVQSDARYRFERGVDPAFTIPGLDLATRMVIDLCGGEPSEILVAGEIPEPTTIIDFDPKEVTRLTGLELSFVEIRSILTRLGFWVAGEGEEVRVAVPTWRPDAHEAADLVEEITRIVGVDRVATVPLPRGDGVPKPVLTLRQNRSRFARRTLAARGLVEAVTWSFIPKNHAEAFGGGAPEIALSNPISSEMSDMRPSLLPGLIAAAQRNADRGFADLALFEIGGVYSGDQPDDQHEVAAGVRRGTAKVDGSGRHWSGSSGSVDAYDAKADAMAVLAGVGAPVASLQVQAGGGDWYHPGRSGLLTLGPKTVLARFGELHPRTLATLDADGPMVAFEVFLDALPRPRAKQSKARSALDASDLMPVRRDFAFVVDQEVRAGAIVRAATGADKTLVADVSVFDVFTGESLGEDRKSIAVEVTLQPRDKTLTDEEIDAVGQKIVAAVEKATGGSLR